MDALSATVLKLLGSYEESGGINHSDGPNLPSKQSVAAIVDDLETLAFPGYRREDGIVDTNVDFLIGEIVHRAARTLVRELERSLDYRYRLAGLPGCPAACHVEARNLTYDFLESLPGIRVVLMEDVAAAFSGDPAAKSVEEVILSYPGHEAIVVHRFANWFWEHGIPLLPRMMSEYVHGKTGIDIHPGARIGRRFFIDHGTGVVIGETAVIGDRVKIYQGVTLGALSVRKDEGNVKRHPTLEDDVTIYSGATILGGQTVIGRGSVIGGNVWLTKSVPPRSRVYMPQGDFILECDGGEQTLAAGCGDIT
ncbi:MAG TPA: serine O-acetyltransferase EpsC [Magnetospirillaceae bacterium]|nr:serine O-acetyltransferase EpsC [Magnetospirillaceae bacterium]